MKKYVLILLSFFTFETLLSQSYIDTYQLNEVNIFDMDNLGNMYFVNGNKILKTDLDFIRLYDYSDKTYGDISFIDVSNPFRILVFYKDFNVLVFLDNKLAVLKSPIFLDELNYYSIDAICNSTYESFRIYDSQNSSVNTISKDLLTTQKGTNLYSLVSEQKAVKLKEANNFVFISFENNNIIVLDKFANYVNSFYYEDLVDFDCINDELYLLGKQEIVAYNMKKEKVFDFGFNISAIKSFKVKSNVLYLRNANSLVCFKIN